MYLFFCVREKINTIHLTLLLTALLSVGCGTITDAEQEQAAFFKHQTTEDVDSTSRQETTFTVATGSQNTRSDEVIEKSNVAVKTEFVAQIDSQEKETLSNNKIIIDANLFLDEPTNSSEEERSLNPITESQVEDLWERIRIGFKFFDHYPLDNPEANKKIERHLKRLPRSINTAAKNATPYLYYIVGELEKNNIPLEIALLPIVESLYDPFAYSPGRAAGLWQFIPSTGKRFGLAQNWWQDERRDTIAATGAAIQYLLYLHKRFDNDWLLALAAYNAGQGNVGKAIRKNKKLSKPTDYWALDLPRETKDYIPKLLAYREIVNRPDLYKVDLLAIKNQAYFDFVTVGTQIDLAEAAKLAEIDIDIIYQLNPAFNRWATDPESPHDLLVPVTSKTILSDKLSTLPKEQRMTWQRYTVKKNDSLIKISKNFNTTPSLLASANNLSSNKIRIGQALLIPSATEASEYYSKSLEQRLARQQQRSPSSKRTSIKHIVSSGETLWDIGRKYKVSTGAIARWNNMATKDVLRINQTLVIWQNDQQLTTAPSGEKRKLFYKVRSGDSLSDIANKFDIKIADIKNWNTDARQKYIKPGQLLTLYVAITNRSRL